MSGRTRLSKNKQIESALTKNKKLGNNLKLANNLNNSYVTIVAEDDPEPNTDTLDSIIADLRSKLADAQQDLFKKEDQVRELTDNLEIFRRRIRLQQDTITELEDANAALSQQMEVIKEYSTRTSVELGGLELADGGEELVDEEDLTRTTEADGGCCKQHLTDDDALVASTARGDIDIIEDVPGVGAPLCRSEKCLPRVPKVTSDHPPRRRPRVLLLSDDQGRFMATKMCGVFGNSHGVQSIFKPNATIVDVLADAPSLTKDFDKKDYVILMAGTNNIIRRQTINHTYFSRILNAMKHTNMIVLTVPYQTIDTNVNHRIFKFNSSLYNYCMKYQTRASDGVFYYDVNYFLQRNLARSINFQLSHREKDMPAQNSSKYWDGTA